MNERSRLARQALREALVLRKSRGVVPNRPVQIYDLVNDLGIELRFLDVPSMEGLYHRSDPATICVSSLRPSGRRTFTCAHELGHHVFGHGTRVDELTDQQHAAGGFQMEEYLADSFASALLMPKAAVDWAFHTRGWVPEAATPAQVYTVTKWLGVGYETLVRHLGSSLHTVSRLHMDSLLRSTPKRIKADFLGFSPEGDLVIADEYWQDTTIDIEVGDLVATPPLSTIEGECIEGFREDHNATLIRGFTPGQGRVVSQDRGWSAYIRVSRRNFVGRSIYRHLKDLANA